MLRRVRSTLTTAAYPSTPHLPYLPTQATHRTKFLSKVTTTVNSSHIAQSGSISHPVPSATVQSLAAIGFALHWHDRRHFSHRIDVNCIPGSPHPLLGRSSPHPEIPCPIPRYPVPSNPIHPNPTPPIVSYPILFYPTLPYPILFHRCRGTPAYTSSSTLTFTTSSRSVLPCCSLCR